MEFRDSLLNTLGSSLEAGYLHGSIAFPDYVPEASDIDFYIVTRKRLKQTEIRRLDSLHRALAKRFEYGRKLDGFYIPSNIAQKSANPKNLVHASHGRIHLGGTRDDWSLHSEHFHGSAYVRLFGPRAPEIFPGPDWPSIRAALYRQLAYARRIIDRDPWWAVLNLCRLVYTFEEGRVVVSKLAAAQWGLKHLPAKWRRLIGEAIGKYGRSRSNAHTNMKNAARKFLNFSSVRIVAFDTKWDSHQPHIAHHRKKRVGVRK